jgi:ribonuclease HI
MLNGIRENQRRGSITVEGQLINIQRRILAQRHPAIEIGGFVDWNDSIEDSENVIYTDGSKLDGKVGAGLVHYEHGEERWKDCKRLPDFASVFQAELVAINEALDHINNAGIVVDWLLLSDSRSALQAIICRWNTNEIVNDIQNKLLSIRTRGISVRLKWVKAHIGIDGNEKADELAKEGTLKEEVDSDCAMPSSLVKRIHRDRALVEWNRNWRTTQNGSWTKRFFPTVELRLKVKNLRLDFMTCQLMTGHGKNNAYLHRFKCKPNNTCHKCNRTEQTVAHLLFDCTSFAALRFDVVTEINRMNLNFSTVGLKDILQNEEARELLFEYHDHIWRNT